MIRVLHCIETISSGGVEQTRLTLARGIDRSRFEFKIICTQAVGPMAEALRAEGVELVEVGPFKHPFEFRKHIKVLQVIKEFQPHIIHGGVFEGMTMATFGGILGRIPIRILEETSDPQNRSKKANMLLRFFSFFADRVQAISPEVGEYLREVSKVRINKIVVIPNGVAVPATSDKQTAQDLKSRYTIRSDEFVIGFVGRLFNDGHKRVTDLIEAVSILANRNVKLLIVGDGKERELIRNRVQEFNLNHVVVFAGYQSNSNLFYEMMDILCIPSSREGFGLVAVEAMMHRLPVVATRVGGLQGIVLDNETGFLVPPHTPRILAEKFAILIEDPELRKSFGEKGYQRAIAHYSSVRYCQEVESLYKELLKEKGIPFD